jgi:hypothetical protein
MATKQTVLDHLLLAQTDATTISSTALDEIQAAVTAATNDLSPPPTPATWPTWRQGLTIDTWYTLNTASGLVTTSTGASLNSAMVASNNHFENIQKWCGAANWNGRGFIIPLQSGHYRSSASYAGWQNGSVMIDMLANDPAWTVMHVGTPLATMQAAGFPSPSIAAPYYPDGLPCGRHLYFSAHHSAVLNKTFVATDYAAAAIQWTPQFIGGPQLDVFDHGTGTWAPAGQYPLAPANTTSTFASVCMDPRTGDIFVTYFRNYYRYTQETGVWTTFAPTVLNDAQKHNWERSSFVDVARNEIVYHYGGNGVAGGLAFVTIPTTAGGAYVGRAVAVTDALYTTPSHLYSTMTKNEDTGMYERIGGVYNATSAPTATVVQIHPDTGVCTSLGTVPGPISGCNNRYQYMDKLGGILYLPGPTGSGPSSLVGGDLMFRPTR